MPGLHGCQKLLRNKITLSLRRGSVLRVLPPGARRPRMERQMNTVSDRADVGSNVAITALIAAVIGTALLFLATILSQATPAQHPTNVATVSQPADAS